MKRISVFRTVLAAFIILVGIVGCEKTELIPEVEPEPVPETEEKSGELTELSKITNDDAIALEALVEETEPVSRVNDVVKYEYRHNKLVAMNYYKRVNTPVTNVANATVLVRTDKFEYNSNNRIAGVKRTFHNTLTTSAAEFVPTSITKKFRYNKLGQISEIIIHKRRGQVVQIRHEFLKYNNMGWMVKKAIRGQNIIFKYEYDRSGNLIRESKYHYNRLKRIIRFYYTAEGNVMYKQILRPILTAASVTDFNGGIIKYEYEPGRNPFKAMRVPYGTLFRSMDELSNHNYIRIATPNREVKFKYRYSLLTGFPLARYTVK